ncbi:hypothetical protein D3C72_1632260 [compost metagenome]
MPAALCIEQFRRHQAGLPRPGAAAHFLIQGVPKPQPQPPRAAGGPLVGRRDGAFAQQAALLAQRIQPRAMPGAAQRAHLGRTRPQLVGHAAQCLHQRGIDGVRPQLAAPAGQMPIRQSAARSGQRGPRPGLEGDCLQARGPHVDTQEYVCFHVMTLSTDIFRRIAVFPLVKEIIRLPYSSVDVITTS